jgi:hypothetical protein
VVPTSFHDFFNGCASVAGALIGLLFVAVSISPEKLTGDEARAEHQIIVLYREHKEQIRHDVRMLAILCVLYGLQLANAVQLDRSPSSVSGIDRQGGLAILFFLFGIARSWQLVGARAIGLASAVTTVIQRPSSQSPTRGGGEATAGGEAGHEPGAP